MMKHIHPLWLCALGALCACQNKDASAPTPVAPSVVPAPALPAAPTPVEPLQPTPRGLPEMNIPAENVMSAEKVALGKALFFDPRLSKDDSTSCQSCHQHELGWADGRTLAPKVGGAMNTRNAPSLYNVGYQKAFYWDGRAATLEDNVLAAWKGNMGADPDAIAAKLAARPGYDAQFRAVFGAAPSGAHIVSALAAFVRTLKSGDSPWDKHEAGDRNALSADAVAGAKLFTGKAQCSLCHVPPLYFDTLYHNVGIGLDKPAPDIGRGQIDPQAPGAFRTPSLRSVAKTAPYFHDGSVATLAEAVKLMSQGGIANPHRDPKLKPTKLSDKELAQLVAFLTALSSDESFSPPALP